MDKNPINYLIMEGCNLIFCFKKNIFYELEVYATFFLD